MLSGAFYYITFWDMVPLLCHQFSSVQVPSQTSILNKLYRCQLVLLDHLLPFYYGHNIPANDEKYLLAKRKYQMQRILFVYQCIEKNDSTSFDFSC